MDRGLLAGIALIAVLASTAVAQPVTVTPADSIQSVLAAQKSKRVMVRLRSGGELTGDVRDVTAKVVVLGTLQGREFFDAVIALDAVEAVVIRTRQ